MISYREYVNNLTESNNYSKLNKNIINFLKNVTSRKFSSGGHDFEENFYDEANKFFKELYGNKFSYVTSKIDVKITKNPIGLMENTKVAKSKNVVSLNKDILYLIPQPNGSQNWPDTALVYNNKVMVFELKSGKTGKITWNSGFPVNNCIYIYNNYSLGETLMFMGEDRAEASTILVKEKFSQNLRNYAKNMLEQDEFKILKKNKINYFLRDMWEDTMNYSKSEMKEEWRNNVEGFISSFNWE